MDSISYENENEKSKIALAIFLLILSMSFISLIAQQTNSWSLGSNNYNSSLTIITGGGITDTTSNNFSTDVAMAQSITGSTNSGLFSTMLGFFFSMGASINQPPSISSVDVTPDNPKINNDLTCTVTGWDDGDGDSAQYHFDWYNKTIHHLHILQVSNTHVLDSSDTTTLETWKCTVTPYDGTTNGSSLSDEVIINNTAPTNPTILLNATTQFNRTQDNLIVWITDGTDIDENSITNITDWRKEEISIAVLNMPFDINHSSIAKDYSTYDNDGTLGNGNSNYLPTWISEGKIGGAYEFDGEDDHIMIGDTYSPHESDFTLEAWFKSTGSSSAVQGIVGRSHAGNGNRFAIYISSSTGVSALIADSSHIGLSSGGSFNENNWHHVVAVYDRDADLSLYLDGEFNKSISISSLNGYDLDPTDNLVIGMYSSTTPQYLFNGSIDEVEIYNHSLSVEQININYLAGVAGHSIENIHSDETSVGDNWTCSVTPNDGYEDGNQIVSNVVEILANQAPNKVTLVSPANNEDTSINRTQILNWTVTTDPENDDLTYEINITRTTFTGEPSCSVNSISESSISILNYTTQELCVDDWYDWKVRANDGSSDGEWSDIWNFSVQSYISVNLLQGNVDFGSILQGASSNTSNDSSNAFKIENVGNVKLNFTIYGNDSLWVRDYADLNTSYFQFKANNSNDESGTFNTGSSQMDWINVTDYAINLLTLLDYNNTKNTALVDILINVPEDEPGGIKNSTLMIISSLG